MSKNEDDNKVCTKCKKYKNIKEFVKGDNKVLKMCFDCRKMANRYRIKYRCKHDKRKDYCKACGTGRCKHDKRKVCCKACGTGRCEHDKRKDRCKACNNPIEITIKKMIQSSKEKDKLRDMYQAEQHINLFFVRKLVIQYPTCYWSDCDKILQYIEYRDDLATIERLDNSIGHIQSNCVFACLRCNKMKKSNW